MSIHRLSLDEVSRSVLALYGLAQHLHVLEFREHALGWMHAHLSFDSAALGTLFYEQGGLRYRSCHLFKQPIEKILEYPAIAHLDPAALTLSNNSFSAKLYSVHDDALLKRSGYAPVLKYVERFGVAQSLGYLRRKGSMGDGLVLWRGSRRQRYSASNGRLAEVLVPHLLQAVQINLAHFTGASEVAVGPAGVVVATAQGVVSAFDQPAVELLAKEWPQWQPPFLPRELVGGLASAGALHYRGKHLCATRTVTGAALIVRLQPASSLARITPAEWRVAELLARGESYKAVARWLGISDATVRNHAHAVYSKLQLKTKAELARYIALNLGAGTR